MSGEQNWTINTNAEGYFGSQKKQAEVADRRPVIRQASDLVGPGIGAGAIMLTDYRNELALFNGYFSSAPGAIDAPNSTDAFVGTVIGSPTLGGSQSFKSLTTGDEYNRVFTRASFDASALDWGPWHRTTFLTPMASSEDGEFITLLPYTVAEDQKNLPLGAIRGVRLDEFFSVSAQGTMSVLQRGVYSGFLNIDGNKVGYMNASLRTPHLDGTSFFVMASDNPSIAFTIPFTFVNTNDDPQPLVISGISASSMTESRIARVQQFYISRTGDA